MSKILQAVIATVPVLLTPVLLYALAEGILNLGGGEKDLIFVLPWLIWSVLFALCGYIFIYRNWAVGRWVGRSAIFATAGLLVSGLAAHVAGFLGIG